MFNTDYILSVLKASAVTCADVVLADFRLVHRSHLHLFLDLFFLQFLPNILRTPQAARDGLVRTSAAAAAAAPAAANWQTLVEPVPKAWVADFSFSRMQSDLS